MISELWCAKQSLIKENLSCLGVCEIDEKLYLDIFCDFIDNDNETMKKKEDNDNFWYSSYSVWSVHSCDRN